MSARVVKPWFERTGPGGNPHSPDGSSWRRTDNLSQRQRNLDLRDWLAANAHIFQREESE